MIEVKTLIDRLMRFHNVVLEGVSGTGKTYAARRVANAWEQVTGRDLGGRARGRFAITFHPSTAYEDFVEGLRPVTADEQEAGEAPNESSSIRLKLGGEISEVVCGSLDDERVFFFDATGVSTEGGGFGVCNGFFTRVCIEAVQNPEKDYLVLLDELNRANVPRVLGDLLTTLEASQRVVWHQDEEGYFLDADQAQLVTLPYSGRLFFVPSNVYLLATMNTNDYSVAPLDVALRRRFAFVRLEPLRRNELIQELETVGVPLDIPGLTSSVEIWDALNDQLLRPCLGPDAVLGYTYFFDLVRGSALLELRKAVEDAETIELLDALGTGRDGSGEKIMSAFWVQTGAMTGGSANQLDLVRGGVEHGDWGMVHLFLGDDLDRGRSYEVVLRRGDEVYGDPPSVIQFPPDNQTWRLLMNGQTDAGVPFQEHTRGGELRYKVLTFCRLADESYRIRVHPLSLVERFKQLSKRHDASGGGQSGRAYGEFSVAEAPGEGIDWDVWLMWRHQLLPQLIETMSMHGAEPLLDEDTRDEWLLNRAELNREAVEDADRALSRFDEFLAELRLEIRIRGSGLGRAVHVVHVESGPTATGDDQAAAGVSRDIEPGDAE